MRRYLSLRALGLGLVAVVLIVAMVTLGLWQLGAYDDRQATDAATQVERRPVPLDDVMGPDEGFPSDGVGRPVRVIGEFLADEQLYVEELPGSAERYAVVTPLLTDNGAAVLVVRGSSDEASADVPPGDVEVSGSLEPPTTDGAAVDESRVTKGLRVSALVEAVRVDLYGGYVVAYEGAATSGLTPVVAPTPEPSRWAGIRNLLYAFQWWLFAAFVAFMWWRVVADLDTTAAASRQVG
ncbi:MAG: SURF1 family protein [Actinomycetota bacterium]|nr:SURF1 family protein [Actinomycetota bacterium]